MRTGVERMTRGPGPVTSLIPVGVLVASTACAFRVETFAISPGTEHGWVIIAARHSRCATAWTAGMFVTVAIPRSRVLCTSNPPYDGWSHERYYIAEADGSRTPLIIGELVHQRTGFTYEATGKNCRIT